MAVPAEFARSKYVSLTTYKRDGTAVPTPVWHVVHDGTLYVVSAANAWKVKRIRNNGRVRVTVCDVRGRVAPGAPTAEGTARVLDAQGTAFARGLLAKRYVTSRIGNAFARLFRLKRDLAGIAVTF